MYALLGLVFTLTQLGDNPVESLLTLFGLGTVTLGPTPNPPSGRTRRRPRRSPVRAPVLASGGVGTLDPLVEGIRDGHATAVLAASIFHFGTYTIAEAKAHMAKAGLPMRLDSAA